MSIRLQENLWRALLGCEPQGAEPETTETPLTEDRAGALFSSMSTLFGAALANHALGQVAGSSDLSWTGPATTHALLYNKINRTRQLEFVRTLGDWGFDFVVLKGLASAHQIFDDPNLRTTGDVDVLVRSYKDMQACIRRLTEIGYAFDRGFELPPWGFPSAESFLPLVSDDGIVHVDFHIAPDSYPLTKGLSVDRVFDGSNFIDASGTTLRVASSEHHFLIVLANAGRERFGPTTHRSFIDAGRIINAAATLDWVEIKRCAGLAGMEKALMTFCRLLIGLGIEREKIDLSGLGDAVAPAHLQDHLMGFSEREFSAPRKAWIEGRYCYGLTELAHIWGGRAKGLFLPRSGVPSL